MAERRVSATEARVRFGELLDSVVERGDVVFVERAGRAQAVVVSLEEWHRHAGRHQDRWTRAMAALEEHWAHLRERYGEALDQVDIEKEIRAGRQERARQIDDLLH